MKWRVIYLALMIIPWVFGNNNVRGGGEFGPAFLLGLIPAVIIIVAVEVIALIVRLFRRAALGGGKR